MSPLLAALASLFYGIGDFAGGLGSRQISAIRVTPWSQLVGLPLLFVGLVVIGWDDVMAADVVYGALSGVFGLVGMVALYGALAAGTMSTVAPLTGALTALIPVVWGLAGGENITGRQWTGIVLAVVAISLVAREHAHARLTWPVAIRALIASAGFAAFFITLDFTREASGLWPLVAARGVSLVVGLAVLAAIKQITRPERPVLPVVVVAGNADIAANISALLALQTGPLGVTVVLTSIYPVFTALAAVIVLNERPKLVQVVGIALAMVAAVLLAT